MSMIMTPSIRKFALTAHITFSVGWLGAVAAFLALAIAGLISHDVQMVRSAYLAMELCGWYVIVPASLASLLTGIIQSLGTPWGLFRHYWIVVKLFLTIAATFLLLLHMQPISDLAEVAANKTLSNTELREIRIQLIADAGAALLVLLVTTTISVYKPWGKIQNQAQRKEGSSKDFSDKPRKPFGRYVLIFLICLVLLFIIMHLLGGGLGHH